MTMQQMTFLIPPYGSATVTLPDVLTADTYARLDAAISEVLGEQQPASGEPAAATDPGTVECDSWRAHQH